MPKKPALSDKDAMLAEARERYSRGVSFDNANRLADVEDRRFVAGEQWDLPAQVSRAGRPMLTVNRMPQFVKQVTGDMRQNKPAIKVLPVDDRTDPKLAEVMSALVRHIESKSRAHRVYVKAAEHAVIGGIGWWRVLTDYSDDGGFDQEICIDLVRNPLAVVIDPAAVKLTREDMQWAFVTELVDRKQFERDHPTVDLSGFAANMPLGTLNEWLSGDMIRIAEYWTREKKGTRELAMLDDGAVIDLSELDELDRVSVAPRVQQVRKVPKWVVRWRRITGTDVIDEGEWVGTTIPLVPVIGEEIEIGERTVRHGLVRFAKDAQRSYNYFRSAAVETIGLAPKAPFILTPEMIGDYKEMWDQANVSPRPYLLVEPDPRVPGSMPRREPPPPVPVAMYQESQIADADMKATTGIYDASLGARSNETSGVAIQARDHQGEVASYVYTDNQIAAIERTGQILVEIIPKVFTGERVVRIIGEDGAIEGWERVNVRLPDGTLANDLSVGRFDIEVATGPAFATKRQQAVDAINRLMQANPAITPLIGDLLVKALDIPYSDKIAGRLERAMPPGLDPQIDARRQQEAGPPPPPNPAEVMQLEAAEAEVEAKKAAAVKAMADAQKALFELGMMQGDMDMSGVEAAMAAVAQLGEQLGSADAPPMTEMPGAMPVMPAPDGNPGFIAEEPAL